MGALKDSGSFSITGDNQESLVIPCVHGFADVSIRGGFVGAVRIQRSFDTDDDDTDFGDIEVLTGPAERTVTVGSPQKIRVHTEPGDFTSGVAVVRVRQKAR